MALNLMDIPSQGGGWFKPGPAHTDFVAFLVEVHDFERQRPTPYGPKDSALVDVTTFETQADLDALVPNEVQQGCRIEQTVLAKDLAGLKGGATIVTIAQIPSKTPGSNPAWVWRQAGAAAKAKVVEYAAAREAAVDAAVASAPSFD